MRRVLAIAILAVLLLPCVCHAQVLESYMILVNKQNELPRDYVPSDLSHPDVKYASYVQENRKWMRYDAARALEDLFAAAMAQGYELLAISGYRSYDVQAAIYQQRLAETDLYYVSRTVAQPGQSEHQTGLAMDIGMEGYLLLSPVFAETDAYKWLTQHAHEYGFIIRYPEDGEAETGYTFEPWHLRYLGVDMATELKNSGLTMEAWYEQRLEGAHLSRDIGFLFNRIGGN